MRTKEIGVKLAMEKILLTTKWNLSALLLIYYINEGYSAAIRPFFIPNHQISFNSNSISPQNFPIGRQITERDVPKSDQSNQVAEKRFDFAAAASIVPNPFPIFGKDPFWVPHRYFNLCPQVPPGQNTLWSIGCHSNPWGMNPNFPAGIEGNSSNPMAAALGFPPNFPAAMTPFYANMGYPQIVSNALAVDTGNLFTTGGGPGPNPEIFSAQQSAANSALYYNPLLGSAASGGGLYSNYAAGGLQPVPFPFGLPFFNSWNRIQRAQGHRSKTRTINYEEDEDEEEDEE